MDSNRSARWVIIIVLLSPLLLRSSGNVTSTIQSVAAENSTPAVEETERLLPHYCRWPAPYNLSRIEPTFLVSYRDGEPLEFNVSTVDQLQPIVDELHGRKLLRKRIRFVIHGYESNIRTRWLREMADALLAAGDDTVIVIGWGRGADFWVDYPQAAANTQTISSALAFLTTKIRTAVSKSYMHCIGHSLGAHVCGQAGHTFEFDRVTGLDPAGPTFQYCSHNPGLNASSGACVDVVHTNGEPHDGLGRLDPLGHVDFYPSCGRHQPGCRWRNFTCSHHMAIVYFVQSINATYNRSSTSRPSAQGPCVEEKFVDECKPCDDLECPPIQATCKKHVQAFGFWSACSDRRANCGGNNSTTPRERSFGQWFVPVTLTGFDAYCPSDGCSLF